MSRTIKELKKIQEQRKNGNHNGQNNSVINTAIDKAGEEEISWRKKKELSIAALSQNKSGPVIFKPPWFIYALIILLFSLNLSLGLGFFFLLRGYKSEHNVTIAKLSEVIEHLTAKNKAQVETLSGKLKEVASNQEQIGNKIQGVAENVKQLNQNSDSQGFALETINKAKNTLFKRVSEIESKLDKIDSQLK